MTYVHVHECVFVSAVNLCRINFYSRFPSANNESLNKLRFVSVEQLPIDFIPGSLFLPVASIDLILCTFVAFLGLVLCIFIV